jgi:hypothetical protein
MQISRPIEIPALGCTAPDPMVVADPAVVSDFFFPIPLFQNLMLQIKK